VKVLASGEQSEAAEDIDNSAHADVPEKILRGLSAALSGLVYLRSRYRLWEGKLGVFDHDSPNQGDKKDTENTSDHDQRGRLPVGIEGPEVGPNSGENEGGEGEDGTGRDGLSYGAGGSGDVFFE
jgi:hypothetical protein